MLRLVLFYIQGKIIPTTSVFISMKIVIFYDTSIINLITSIKLRLIYHILIRIDMPLITYYTCFCYVNPEDAKTVEQVHFSVLGDCKVSQWLHNHLLTAEVPVW